MRIFKTKIFSRFADDEAIPDTDLKEAARRVNEAQAEVNYGAFLYKVRIARQGGGKSGGYRVLLCARREDKTFFMYGFPKSSKSNINKKEESVYKKLSRKYLELSDIQIEKLLLNKELVEIL